MDAPITRRRFTVYDLEKMVEVGILTEDDRIELIDGEIVEMSANGAKHVGSVLKLDALLRVAVDDAMIVSVQNPVRLHDSTEPLPDLAVLR